MVRKDVVEGVSADDVDGQLHGCVEESVRSSFGLQEEDEAKLMHEVAR